MNVIQRITNNAYQAISGHGGKKFTYIIGNNGTGKSRLLQGIVDRLTGDNDFNGYIDRVLCITNTVYDKFKFSNSERIRYLGLRNVSNAIFHTIIDRQLIYFICRGIQSDKNFLDKLENLLGLKFAMHIQPDGKSVEACKKDLTLLIDKRKLNGRGKKKGTEQDKEKTINDLLNDFEINFISSKVDLELPMESLGTQEAKAVENFINLNPTTTKLITYKNSTKVNFNELSSGEQNRALIALKILANIKDGCILIIDEPEISLHLHWQMEFHSFLRNTLSKHANLHAIIATHSPIIVAEATKDSETDSIIILEGKTTDGNVEDIEYREGKKESANGYDQIILDFFDTATYNSTTIDEEIARTVISASESNKVAKEIDILNDLLNKKGLPIETEKTIKEAIELIERHFI